MFLAALVAATASHSHACLQSTGHSCFMIWGSQQFKLQTRFSCNRNSRSVWLVSIDQSGVGPTNPVYRVSIALFGGWSSMHGVISRRIVPRRNTCGRMRLTFSARNTLPALLNLFCNSGEPRYGLQTYLVLANYRLR